MKRIDGLRTAAVILGVKRAVASGSLMVDV